MSSCIICIKTLTPPVKVLNCGHSFCHSCVEGLRLTEDIRDDEGNSLAVSINCPTCRQETMLHERGIEFLPTNYALNALLTRRQNAIMNENSSNNGNSLNGKQTGQTLSAVMRSFDRQERIGAVTNEERHFDSVGILEALSNNVWYCRNDWCQSCNYDYRRFCRLCFTERPTAANGNPENIARLRNGEEENVVQLTRCSRSNNENRSFWALL